MNTVTVFYVYKFSGTKWIFCGTEQAVLRFVNSTNSPEEYTIKTLDGTEYQAC